MATSKSALKPNLKGRGGANRGQGRKPNVLNEKTIKKIQSFAANAALAREIAQEYLPGAIHVLAVKAGAAKVPLIKATGANKGEPEVGPMFDDVTGEPILDERGRHKHGPKMVYMPADTDGAQVQAAKTLVELAAGKPTQALANDPDNPITDIKPSGKVVFGWPEGYVPPTKDGKNRVLPNEVPGIRPANDDDEGDEPEEKNA